MPEDGDVAGILRDVRQALAGPRRSVGPLTELTYERLANRVRDGWLAYRNMAPVTQRQVRAAVR